MSQGILQRPALVLNRSWQPIHIATVARALRTGIDNFTVLCAHKLIPPALDALVRDEELVIVHYGDYGPETYIALADALEADEEFITTVQEDLMELKLYPGPADGDYGSGTVKGIEALQEQCDIDVDGRFTPQTHLCLEAEMDRL